MENTVKSGIQKIIEDVENTAQDFEHIFSISEKFVPAINLAKEIGDNVIEQELIWEYQLFQFVTNTEYAQAEKNRRFYPMISGTTEDGRKVNFPEVDNFNNDSIEYFKKRANETQNPVLKSRYADFVWEVKKDPSFGKIAVDSYIETARGFYEKTWFFRLKDAFKRCVYLAMLGVVDKDKLQEIKNKLLGYIDEMIKNGNHQFCLWLIDAFLLINGNLDYCSKLEIL